jgi:heme exporter protein D
MQNEYQKEMLNRTLDAARSATKTLQIGAAGLTALAILSGTQGKFAPLLATPFVLGLLLTYQGQAYSDIWGTAWQQSGIVSAMEKTLGGGLFGDDVGVTRHARANPSIVLIHASLFGLLCCSIGAGYVVLTHGGYSAWIWAVYSASVVLVLLSTLFVGLENRRGWRRAELLTELRDQRQHLSYAELTDALVRELGKPGRVWVHGRQMIQRIPRLLSRYLGRSV